VIPLAQPLLTGLAPNELRTFAGLRDGGHEVGIRRLSARPYLFHLQGWLTDDECDRIVTLAAAEGDPEVAKTEGSEELSTSWRVGCELVTLHPSEDEGLRIVTRDASQLVFGEAAWQRKSDLGGESEDLQVLRYAPSGFFNVHYDACWEAPRAATLLYYLNGVGETWFPLACEDMGTAIATMPTSVSEAYERCFALDPSQDGVRVRPRKGDALLLYNFDEDADIDLRGIHAGLPVDQGCEKLLASQFVLTNNAQPLG
jgi:prolyl 4-hydroxylase